MIAETLDRLAMQIRLTEATNPAEFEAQVEVLEADARASWESAACRDGLEAGRRQARPTGSAFGHDA